MIFYYNLIAENIMKWEYYSVNCCYSLHESGVECPVSSTITCGSGGIVVPFSTHDHNTNVIALYTKVMLSIC